MKLKRLGDLARTMGSTQMNRDSSRSHTMFSLLIQYRQKFETKISRQGKLNFVDLGKLRNEFLKFITRSHFSIKPVVNDK